MAEGEVVKVGCNGIHNSIMDGVCDLREETAANREVVKDAECNIRHDIGAAECQIIQNVKDAECNVRHDVLKSESDIRRDVVKESGEIRRDVKMTESNLKDVLALNFCALGKDIAVATYETKLGVQQVIKEVNAHVDNRANRTDDKVSHGFEEVNEVLCDFRKEVAKEFCGIREQHLELENRELRDKLGCCKEQNQTQTLLRAICCGCPSTEGGPGNSGK